MEELIDADVSTPIWGTNNLRIIRYEPTAHHIIPAGGTLAQRVYKFSHQVSHGLSVRCTRGLQHKDPVGEFIWLLGHTQGGIEISIGIDAAFIFQQTDCLVNRAIIQWGGQGHTPILDIVCAVIQEFELLLGCSANRLLTDDERPKVQPSDFVALDHKSYCRVLVLGSSEALNEVERTAKGFCADYWTLRESMGGHIAFKLDLSLYLLKKRWSSREIDELNVGDLLLLENRVLPTGARSLRGTLAFPDDVTKQKSYEVYLSMNDENSQIEFGLDDPNNMNVEESIPEKSPIPPHEEIQLEIMAGRTTVLFNDLCAVQEGTLIELKEHALPVVTLSVSGVPLLEGELVVFQDHIMVQVTKRLD